MRINKYFRLSFLTELYNKSFIGQQLQIRSLPGFGGVPIGTVLKFFYLRLRNEAITMRSAAIAFRIFIALFPALIVFFSIIPYIPIANLQEQLLMLLEEFLPEDAFQSIQLTITDIVLTRRSALLSFSFLLAAYFASNGIISLFYAFNSHNPRPFWQTYLIAFSLVFLISVVLLFTIIFQIAGEYFISYLRYVEFIPVKWISSLIWWFKFFTTLFLSLTTISILYHFGTVKSDRFRFYSPGVFLAATLILITSYAFGYYIDNFSRYNMLYGSLGALIVLMMWIYLNAFGLILGYEFNQSIFGAKKNLS